MRPYKSRTFVPIIVLAISFFGSMPRLCAAPDTFYRFRRGVHIHREHPLTGERQKKIAGELRFWTGLTQIHFDHDGNLTLGDRTQITGGSVTARKLIVAAVDSQNSFALVDAGKSPQVAFAQIASTERYLDGVGQEYNGWEIRIDFSDFAALRGSARVLTAFDPAANLLHELTHGVHGYVDPVESSDQLGQCERHINRMRAELGLPQRLNYYPRNRWVMGPPNQPRMLQGEVTFVLTNAITNSNEEFLVTFNEEKVVDLSKVKSRAVVQSDLVRQMRSRN